MRTFLFEVLCFIHHNPRGYTGPPDCACYSPIRRNSPAVTRQNDSLRSEQIDIGLTNGSSWAKADSHVREMHVVAVRRDAPHALDPLAFPGARSHSRKIGFRKADAPDRQQRVESEPILGCLPQSGGAPTR